MLLEPVPPRCHITREELEQLNDYERYELRLLVTLRKADRHKHHRLFKHIKQILREFYMPREHLQWIRAALSISIPSFPSVTIKAALICFLLLSIMPVHPLSIPAALGGGISAAFIIHTCRILIEKIA